MLEPKWPRTWPCPSSAFHCVHPSRPPGFPPARNVQNYIAYKDIHFWAGGIRSTLPPDVFGNRRNKRLLLFVLLCVCFILLDERRCEDVLLSSRARQEDYLPILKNPPYIAASSTSGRGSLRGLRPARVLWYSGGSQRTSDIARTT